MSFILCKYCENRRQEPPRGKHHGKRCVNCKKRHCHHGSDTCSPACDMENLTKVMRQVRAEENHVTRRHRQKALAAAWTKDKRRAASRSMMEIRADVNLEQHRSASQSDAWHNKTKRDRRKIATKISISRRMVRRKIVRAAKDAYRRKSPEAKTASLANLKLGRPALAKIRRGMPTRPERVGSTETGKLLLPRLDEAARQKSTQRVACATLPPLQYGPPTDWAILRQAVHRGLTCTDYKEQERWQWGWSNPRYYFPDPDDDAVDA